MDLFVRLEGRDDLARQIYRQIRQAIVERKLARGERLPATRELASRLSVARNTVGIAYEWLTAEGLISGRRGAGSFVEESARPHDPHPHGGAAIRYRTIWNRVHLPVPRTTPPRFDFGVGMPDGAPLP